MIRPTTSFLSALLLLAPLSAKASQLGVQISLGEATQHIEEVNFSDSDLSFGVAGLYAISSNFATELRFDDFGTVKYGASLKEGELSASAISAGIIGMLPIHSSFIGYAKIGAASCRTELSDALGNNTSNSFNLYYGFGAEYLLGESIGITAEYNVIELEAYAYDIIIDYKITNLSLGLRYYLD